MNSSKPKIGFAVNREGERDREAREKVERDWRERDWRERKRERV